MGNKAFLPNIKQTLVCTVSAALGVVAAIPAYADPVAPNTSVTFYGVADVNMTGMDSGFGQKFSFGSGGFSASRLGFKVTRDFGDGLQAIGVAEGGLLYDTGLLGNASVTPGINNSNASSGGQAGTGPQIFSRQAFAGLSGSFGAATIGRQHSPSYIAAAFIGAAKGDGLLGYSTSLLPLIGGMPTRLNNSFLYVTPKASGFSGSVMYTTGNENNVNTTVPVGVTSTNDKAGRGFDVGMLYSKGPLNAALTTWRINNVSYATAGETDLAKKDGWQLAANYDFGIVRLYGSYVDGKISGGNYEAVTKTLSSASGATVSALFPFGKHRFAVSYTHLDDKSSLNRDAKLYGIGYWYELDAKSKIYAGLGSVKNGRNATYSLADGGNLVGNVTVPGTTVNGLMAGVNFAW